MARKMSLKQSYKLYKNSECVLCGCFLCEVKMGVTKDGDIIVCYNCYKKIKRRIDER